MIRDLLVLILVLCVTAPVAAFQRVVLAPPGQGTGGIVYEKDEPACGKPKARALKRSPTVVARERAYIKAETERQAMAHNPRTRGFMEDLMARPDAPKPPPTTVVQEEAPVAVVVEPPPLSPEDAALAGKLGLNLQTGVADNPTKKAFDFQIDSFGAYVKANNELKLGLAPVVWKTVDGHWAICLDVANDLVGGSLNYQFIPVIRLRAGIGYGRLLGNDAKDQDARGESRNTFYLKGSIRLW